MFARTDALCGAECWDKGRLDAGDPLEGIQGRAGRSSTELSFLRSSRKEQMCGGVAEMRRKLKRAVACAGCRGE